MAYFAILALYTFSISAVKPNTVINNKYNARILIWCLVIFVGFRIAFMNAADIPDLQLYANDFLLFHSIPLSDALKAPQEPLFIIFQWILSRLSTSVTFYQVSIWVLFASIFLTALRNILSLWQVLLVFFSYITYFEFVGYISNTVREGIAISLLMLALSIVLKENQRGRSVVFYLLIVSAPLVHLSSLPLAVFLLFFRRFNPSTKSLVAVWTIAAALFLSHQNVQLLSGLGSHLIKLQTYSSMQAIAEYARGTDRPKMVLFSSFWLAYALFFLKRNPQNIVYRRLVKVYIAFNVYFLLFGFIAFSDRISAYSWMLVPLLVWMPIFDPEREYHPLLSTAALCGFLLIGFVSGSMNYLF